MLVNLYVVYRLHVEHEVSIIVRVNSRTQALVNETDHRRLPTEFLVLDWTGNQHIFREPDTIPCE